MRGKFTAQVAGNSKMELPQKKFYRQRAHSNPLADHCFDYPANPDAMNWKKFYTCHKTEEDLKVGII